MPEDLVEVVLGQLDPIGKKLQRQILIEMGLNVHERGNNPVEWRCLLSAHPERRSDRKNRQELSRAVEYSLAT
jgi:hypothetical protein